MGRLRPRPQSALRCAPENGGTIRLSGVVSSLSLALDLTEGQPMGHAIRTCILGMRIAEELQLSSEDCCHLYYALLLKDSGCSSNAARLHRILGGDEIQAKREIKLEDWTKASVSSLRYLMRNVLPEAPVWRRAARIVQLGLQRNRNSVELARARCERGAEIACGIGLNEAAAEAIRNLDEHWDGGGVPAGRKGDEIPLLARILSIAQTLEVFASNFGSRSGFEVLSQRSGTWFDPHIVRAVRFLEHDQKLWQTVMGPDARARVLEMEPGLGVPATPERIDNLCLAFAKVIDAKSPYTFHHSVGVAAAALEIAQGMGLALNTITMIRRAALLHDIGKLSVSNAILEKPGPLTAAEWKAMKMHPVYSRAILRTIAGFEQLAFVAAAHHERLDGSGYPDGLTSVQLPLAARIIAVADVFAALTEKRPYRDSVSADAALQIIERETPHRLDGECFAVLRRCHSGVVIRESCQAQFATA